MEKLMREPADIFAEEHFVGTRRPLHQALSLPAWCYTSERWYEREVERIFWKEWLCVGRADQVANAGDYVTIDLAGVPVVIVRDGTGVIRAHVAVCRHRGAVVVSGQGNCKAFHCPYHDWTYSLRGELLSTPGRSRPMDVEDFNKAEYGLVSIGLEGWEGFLFVNFDSAAPPLRASLGNLSAVVRKYRPEEMRSTRRVVYEVPCNWKVYVEGAVENYHVQTVHRNFYPKGGQVWTLEESGRSYEVWYGTRSLLDVAKAPLIDGLSGKELDGVYLIAVYPISQILLTPTYIRYQQCFPEGVGKVRFVVSYAFPRSTIERADFAEMIAPSYYARGTIEKQGDEWIDEVFAQDIDMAAVVQRGLRSGFYLPGRLSPLEAPVHRFANYVLDRVLTEG